MKRQPKIYNMEDHRGWGNTIAFIDWDKRQITGHKLPQLEKGDELRVKMESGKTGRFKVTEIKYMLDPRDQFFGKVEDIGYVED